MSIYNLFIKRSREFCLLVLIQFLGLTASGFSASTIGCKESSSSVKTVTFSSEVVLNRSLIDRISSIQSKVSRQKFYEDAAELQVKHLIGLLRTTRENGMNAALGSFRKDLRIKQIDESVQYGTSLVIDNYLQPKRDLSQSAHEYVRLALESKQLKKQDLGVRFEYSVQLMVADCSKGDFEAKAKLQLPKDPFLSLWVEDASARKARFWGPETAVISGCHSNEFIQFGSPDQAWFFWSPLIEKKIDKDKSAHCRPIENSTVVAKISDIQSLKNSDSIDESFFKYKEPFQFYAVFGEISSRENFLKPDFVKLREEIRKISDQCTEANRVADCLTFWEPLLKVNPEGKVVEPGLFYFLIFLKDLNSIVDLDTLEVDRKVLDQQIQIKASGKFRNSKKAMVLKAFFGRTTLDWGPPGTFEYSKFLNEATRLANSISYLGHSGLGVNLKITEWEKMWKRDRLKAVQRTAPLWLGVYNCEGFSYFGLDLVDVYKPGHTDVLMTLSTGVEAEAKFPLAQLSAADQILSGKKGKEIQELIGKFVHTKDFYTEVRLQGNGLLSND